jgi:CRISPR-associated endonuclease/helicase Cas3
LPVRIDVFKKWLAGEDGPDESGDVEGEAWSEAEEPATPQRRALRWAGPDSNRTTLDPQANTIRPGDTFVVSVQAPGLVLLGDFLTLPPTDQGDEAFIRSRDRAILRLPGLDLRAEDDDFDEKLTAAVEAQLATNEPDWHRRALEVLKRVNARTVEPYPEPLAGWVVSGKRRLRQFDPTYLDDSEPEESFRGRPVTLEEHSRGVAGFARRFAAGCGLPTECYSLAGFWHDLGKLDPRFQAMLKGRSPRTAGGVPLAKSGTFRRGDRSIHCYPRGGRHELLSVVLLSTTADDLLLHLIATHHGTARPFADPVEENDAARRLETRLFGAHFHLETTAQNPSAWNAGFAERFWRMVRRYGWWGVAYREAVVRLADHAQSRREQETDRAPSATDIRPPAWPLSEAPVTPLAPIELTGLDGANPLALLAAVGTLRLADQLFKGQAKLHWTQSGRWMPILSLPADQTQETLVNKLYGLVHRIGNEQAAVEAKKHEKVYQTQRKAVDAAAKAIKARKLRGDQRAAAWAAEVTPLEGEAASTTALA